MNYMGESSWPTRPVKWATGTGTGPSFQVMAQRQRTQRGSGMDRVQIKFLVSPHLREKVNLMADAVGKSQSQVIERLLEAVEVDEQLGTVTVAGHVIGHIVPDDEALLDKKELIAS